MKRIFLMLLVSLAFQHVTNATILDSLYLIKESVTYNATTFYKGALSDSLQPMQFDNAVITVQGSANDSIVIMNMDTIDYQLYLNSDSNQSWTILAEDTMAIELPLLDWGTHAIISSTTEGKLLGTACILQVDLQADHIYSWDQWDMNNVLSQEVAEGNETSIPSTYRPNVFTINADPLAPMDTSNALIHGYVGDTILISVLNSGNMVHNIHFHGYHCTILSASKQSDRVGWSKDSFPVMIGETMTLRLVPDQPGVYPVHNHNLATLLYNNNYPSGMMTMIKIYE